MKRQLKKYILILLLFVIIISSITISRIVLIKVLSMTEEGSVKNFSQNGLQTLV